MKTKYLARFFLCLGLLIGSFGLLGIGSQSAYAEDTGLGIPGGFGDTDWVSDEKGGEEIKVYQTEDAEVNDNLMNTIKRFINWALGLLALVALIILLVGGFQMLTAAGNETKYKKGFTILKQAAVALAFIGLSWLIVSLIFWIIGTVAKTK